MFEQKSNTMRTLMALIAMLFFVQVALVGCVGKKNTSQTLYASLASASAVYNSTHDLVKQLGAEGKLDRDQKVKIKEAMGKAEQALLASGVALDAYVRSSTDENKLAFEAQILAVNQLVISITTIIGGTD